MMDQNKGGQLVPGHIDQIHQDHIAAQEAMMEILDFERRRIGLDLHDRVQNKLRLFRDKFVDRPEFYEIQDILDELRSIAYQLVPKSLQAYSLKDYLNIYETTLNQIYGRRFKSDYRSNVTLSVPKNIETQLFSILQECVNNVIKHASETPTLIIRYRQSEDDLVLMIQDFGEGFDPLEIEGIGLKSIRIRCKFIGASCDIQSAKGEGCKIKITLPLVYVRQYKEAISPLVEDMNEVIEDRLNEFIPLKKKITSGKKILIVDNQIDILEGLKVLIDRHLGEYELLYCQSAKEARDHIKNHEGIYMLITDITMPDESGIQLVKEVRKANKSIKCVFYTINDNPAYVFEAKRLAVSGYVWKEHPNAKSEMLHPLLEAIRHLSGSQDPYYSANIEKIILSFEEKTYDSKKDKQYREVFMAYIKLLKDNFTTNGKLSKDWRKMLSSKVRENKFMNIDKGTIDRYFRGYKEQLGISDDEEMIRLILRLSNDFGFFTEE